MPGFQPGFFKTTKCAAVSISVTKDGIKFSATGDIGSANVTIRQNNGVDLKVQYSINVWLFASVQDSMSSYIQEHHE
jgi:hypothetical protein